MNLISLKKEETKGHKKQPIRSTIFIRPWINDFSPKEAPAEEQGYQQAAEKVIFSRLLKKDPACAEASAGRQMQVELCEIPPAGASEILRSEACSGVRRNDLPR
jgi:hypothetical protein